MEIDPEAYADIIAPRGTPKMEARRPRSNRNRPDRRHSENKEERAERVVTEFINTMLKKVQPQDKENQMALYLDWVKRSFEENPGDSLPYTAFEDSDLKVGGDRQIKISHLPTLLWFVNGSEPTGELNAREVKDVMYDVLSSHMTDWGKTSESFRQNFGVNAAQSKVKKNYINKIM